MWELLFWSKAVPSQPGPGTNSLDFYGVQLAVGQNVRLEGSIASINTSDTRYNNLTLTLACPVDNTITTVIVPSRAVVAGN